MLKSSVSAIAFVAAADVFLPGFKTPPVSGRLVAEAPEGRECRHRENNRRSRLQDAHEFAERLSIVYMLEHVECDRGIEMSIGQGHADRVRAEGQR